MVFGWKKKNTVKEESQIIDKSVDILQVRDIIQQAKEQQSEHLITQTKKIHAPITQHLEALLKIAIDLEKDPLATDDIDINIATIVRRGKKQVLAVIHKEAARDIPQIESVDDARAFNKQSSQALSRIGDILGKQTRVIHIFAKKYASKLKEILARYTDDDAQAKRLLATYESFEKNHVQIASLLKDLTNTDAAIDTHAQKISNLHENESELDKELAALDEKISRFKESENYKKYLDIQEQMRRLDSEKSSIENDINNQTILISRPMSKYEYGSSLDKEQKVLIEKFLSAPFEIFLSANKPALVTILENIKKAISLKHMSLKEPEKMITYVDDIASKIDRFVGMVESFNERRDALLHQMRLLDIDTLEGYQKLHEKTKGGIEFAQSRIRDLENENDSLGIKKSVIRENIQSTLNRLGRIRYTLKE